MSLAEPQEPLVLADGTTINPTSGKEVRDSDNLFIEIASGKKAKELVTKTKRSIADLPAAPKESNAFALVAFYTMFGLSTDQIALAMNTTEENVINAKASKVYLELKETVEKNYVSEAEDQVRSLLQQNAMAAVTRVVEHAKGDNDVLSFKASQDILDRAGHRPADVVNVKHTMENSLNIVYTEDKKNNIIDGDFIDLDGAI